jgi:amino acid adenylation domain-containing protein
LHRHTGEGDQILRLRNAGVTVARRFVLDPDLTGGELIDAFEAQLRDTANLESSAKEGHPPLRLVLEVEGGLGVLDGAALLATDPLRRPELQMEQEGDCLRLRYDGSLFAEATAQRFLQHVVRVLEGMRSRPAVSVGQLPVGVPPLEPPTWDLPSPVGWEALTPPCPGEDLVARLAKVVGAQGDRLALRGASGELSYRELGRRTSWTAHRLRGLGLAGRRVGLLVEHDLSGPVAMWAALKAGAAYTAPDPRNPDARLMRLLRDAEVSAVLCDDSLVDRAHKLAYGVPVLSLAEEVPEGEPPIDEPVPASDVAYLLHTSGSTGRPKAVLQSRRNVFEHAMVYAERTRLAPGDALALLAPVGVDAAVMDVFGALLSGTSLHIVDPVRPPAELWEVLVKERVTVLHCTPTLLRHLLDDGPGTFSAETSLRLVVLGGEEARPDDARRVFEALPGCELINGLGPSECTIALQHRVTAADLDRAAVPIGRPVEGVAVDLLDAAGRSTEVFGELALVTDRVALGYWMSEQATEAAFDTLAPGVRRYRTGDLARLLPDGLLVFAGRKDRQVKLLGHRVELGEIEVLLRNHPTVAQAAVVLDGSAGGLRLVAYLTPATAFAVSPDEILDFLRRQLPPHAVPSAVVALREMPLTSTGKLDRSQLRPSPQGEAPVARAAGSPSEEAVAAVWREVLGLPFVDVTSDFMVSGGDSIQILSILALVEDRLGVRVELLDFLSRPTVAGLATHCDRQMLLPGAALAPDP